MILKQDCKYFLSDRPCRFHKEDNSVVCDNCPYYIKSHPKYTTQINSTNISSYKDTKDTKRKKVVIIKLAALGDVVRTTAVLKPVYKKWCSPQVYWVTYKNAVDILKNNPYVSKIVSYEESYKLFGTQFDVLINFDLDKDALNLTLNIFAKEKFGFYLGSDGIILCSNKPAQQWFYMSHNDVLKKNNKKTYQQYMTEILELKKLEPQDYPIIINLNKQEKLFAKRFAIQHSIVANDTVVGINLGGGGRWQKKEYPVNHTVELIKHILNDSQKLNRTKILLFGGEKEKLRNKKIMSLVVQQCPSYRYKIIDTGCDNPLRKFFALLNLCDILVTSDTMALHVALGLKKKVLALFGPTSSTEIEMYGLGEKIVSTKDCIVCYNPTCSKEPDCMQEISPQKVYNKLLQMLTYK